MDKKVKEKIAYDLRLHVGSVIRTRREAKNMTLRHVALETGISVPTLSKYERGEQEIPLARLAHICYVCNINMTELVVKDGIPMLEVFKTDPGQGQPAAWCVRGAHFYFGYILLLMHGFIRKICAQKRQVSLMAMPA